MKYEIKRGDTMITKNSFYESMNDGIIYAGRYADALHYSNGMINAIEMLYFEKAAKLKALKVDRCLFNSHIITMAEKSIIEYQRKITKGLDI